MPAASPAAAPAAAPAASPAAGAAAKPAASPAAAPAAKPAASPAAAAPAAKTPSFDEKAVADFYSGKTIRMVVGAGAGGGFDTYTRAIARHIPRHIPGQPNIIVENKPGAGGATALNTVYTTEPQDGTVIAHPTGAFVTAQLQNAQGVQYDATKGHYLGAPFATVYVLVADKRAGVTSMDQLIGPNAKEMTVGVQSPGSTPYNIVVLSQELLEAKLRVIPGYESSNNLRVVMERGEVQSFPNSWESIKVTSMEKITSGEWIPLVQFTDRKLTDLPNVPTVIELAKTPEAKELLDYGIVKPNIFSRPYLVAPGVPMDRVLALRQALEKTFADPEFRAEAQRLQLDVDPVGADELAKSVADYLRMPGPIKERLVKFL
jgi:tripartite-type tricarboxylate transporter receptor subunit TctC